MDHYLIDGVNGSVAIEIGVDHDRVEGKHQFSFGAWRLGGWIELEQDYSPAGTGRPECAGGAHSSDISW